MELGVDEWVIEKDAMKFEHGMLNKRFKIQGGQKSIIDLKDSHKRLKEQLRDNVCRFLRKVKTITNLQRFPILFFKLED